MATTLSPPVRPSRTRRATAALCAAVGVTLAAGITGLGPGDALASRWSTPDAPAHLVPVTRSTATTWR
jgi:hypothetical protein